jgi:Holliday junction resolvase RusA-like endonuclease
MITFTVPGQPQGKGRPRVGKVGGHARMFTPEKTASYEGLIAHSARVAMDGRPLLEGAAACNVFIDCQVPASWSGKRQRAALAGEVLPTAKPDADNVVKAVFDGINGVVWRDDVLCVDVRVRKRYSATPCVRVEVWALERPVPDMTARAPAARQQGELLGAAV